MPYKDPERRRAAAREAMRRWYQRHKETLRPVRRQRDRARYAANRESALSAKRDRYASDPEFAEQIRASNRAWYERNRDARREYRRRYRLEHGDRMRAQERARERRKYAEDPRAVLDYYKQWRQRNLAKARAYVRASGIKRRAASLGQHFTAAEWLALVETYGSRCAYCGLLCERLEADHRVPLCRGGSNLIENILPACKGCNRRKYKRTEDEFRAVLAAERAAAEARSRATDSDGRAAER